MLELATINCDINQVCITGLLTQRGSSKPRARRFKGIYMLFQDEIDAADVLVSRMLFESHIIYVENMWLSLYLAQDA